MGSIQMSCLDYLRSRTQVDYDSLDPTGLSILSPDQGLFQDVTSNQFEVYDVISKPESAQILRKGLATAKKFQAKFPDVVFEELAFDVCAVYLGLRIIPFVAGNLHLMANPKHTFSVDKVIAHGERYHKLCELIDPSFDHMNRLVMKVACTWEGMQAAKILAGKGIKCLATTVFTMEQAILAGEVGCVSLSPFVHELKAIVDETYTDSEDILDMAIEAQLYYKSHNMITKVKGCATKGLTELMQLAGMDAYTAIPPDLEEMARTRYDPDTIAQSKFDLLPSRPSKAGVTGTKGRALYVDDECRFRKDFARADGGKAQYKIMQAMAIFCDQQDKGEVLMKTTMAINPVSEKTNLAVEDAVARKRRRVEVDV